MEEKSFGRYRLRELLGRGGMGEVWRAYDTVTNRIVALKMLLPHSADDAEFQRRFRREAEAAASLNDPHVVPIHDYGEIDDRLFVTMRLIDGRDLGEVLRLAGGPLPPARAVHIVEQVAEALDAAHAVGLVHRDIKPSNVLVTPRDFVYLIDFGIAHTAGATRFTSTGVAVGTLAYMSPERFEANVSEPPSDIYALTCVLYECLTGQLPFPGDSLPQQIAAHLTKPPPKPSAIAPGVPPAFDDVIAKGMAKTPSERYQTTMDLADAARAAVRVEAPPEPVPSAAPPQFTPLPRPIVTDRPTPAPATVRPPAAAPRPAPASTPAHAMPVRQPLAEPVAPQRKSINRRWMVFGAVGLVCLVIAAVLIGRTVIRGNFYVAVQDPMVYIMRGMPGSLLGIRLADPFQIACLDDQGAIRLIGADDDRTGCRPLKVNDLNDAGQQQVKVGLQGGSLDHARQSIKVLVSSSLLPVCQPPPNPIEVPEVPTTVSALPPSPIPTPTVIALPPPSPELGKACRAAA